MASHNKQLWRTVIFLFLSKFVKRANEPFAQKSLINTKNVELASKFTEMVGDTTAENKIKLTLVKALNLIEKEGLIHRLDETMLQLSEEGFSTMQTEVQTAMTKIAQNFPETKVKEKPAPAVQ
ncbi:MAG: hypothetical protein U9R29_05545 [Thermodesulfobacteriota bacterium]|nr:hypothetical protein [Thermodesulfobacteriota bacterium]